MANIGKRTLLREVNPHLVCPLCRGYLIDATTVVECLHSFCRSCILKHLNKAAHCPSCKHVLNKAKPNIKADKALQDIVYKLVPGLYQKEMRKRREFYKKHPEHADSATPEQRGEDVSGRLIFAPEDAVSLSLEYLPLGVDPLTILNTNDTDTNHSNGANNNKTNNNHNNGNTVNNRRYLQCPALVTIAHLKKFLALKYSVDMTRYTIEICHRRAPLPEHWTLMDVAYIYAWKRIAPMRFFYRIAQEEQKLEAPLHQRPSTPGLGACLPPNDAVVIHQDNLDGNSDNIVNQSATCRSEVKSVNESRETSIIKDSNKNLSNGKINLLVDNKQMTAEAYETKKAIPLSTAMATIPSSSLTTTMSSSTTTCYDPNNKQVKSPIKIMKNQDGNYEVLKNPPLNWNAKEQTAAASVTDIKPTNPEFSVVSIGNGQNSNGVKITLKQCSPTSGTSVKKPKVISNVLLRCGQVEKDSSGALVIQQLPEDKDTTLSPPTQDKQEKQRRKVTFIDQPISEKISNVAIVSKTVLKKPAEQQDKKQFLQSIQLTARESVSENIMLKSSVRDAGEISSSQKNNATLKTEELLKKDVMINDEATLKTFKKRNNTENVGSNTNTVKQCEISANNPHMYANKGSNNTDERSFNSVMNSDMNTNANSHSTAKMDIYTFHSSDSPIVPAGAVKRKCPPGVPIIDLKHKRQKIQTKSQGSKKQIISSQNLSPVKHTSLTDHIVSANKTVSVAEDSVNHMSNMNNNSKVSNNPMISNDTRNLLDGCGLSIPASLSITLTAPKSPGASGQFAELNNSNDNVRKATVLGKVNPSITLNDRSVDPRVLKALKTGQIRMPVSPKIKSLAAETMKQANRSEMNQQQRVTPKRKKEQESILDLSGSKKIDIHPLRVPQPVTKFKTNNKVTNRDGNIPNISDQSQVVTLIGGHRYYRAPPGSLTPAAHRVNDCPPSRTPVYAPTLTDTNRTSSNLSSVFPSLQSLYALSQVNLQQFQMDTRLRPPSRVVEDGDNSANSSNTNNMPNKSHLAAQCAPIKPARSSVASLAVPINKQQSTDKSASISINKTNDIKKQAFCSENLASINETAPHLTVQMRYSSDIENTNKFLSSRSNVDEVKSNDQSNKNSRNSNTESKNESMDIDNSIQQHHDTASPRVSSTASPSPPPDNSGINTRNENTTDHDDNFNNSSSSNGNNSTTNISSNIIKTAEIISSKSPASPDSSSIAVESSTGKNCTLTDREVSTDSQTSNIVKTNNSIINSDNIVDESVSSVDNKKQFANQPVDAKQLTSEIVQKRLLAVFPSNEWVNNPIAAEHLGNFLKSLNVTIKTEGNAEGSKIEKAEQKKIFTNDDIKSFDSNTSVKLKKDVTE